MIESIGFQSLWALVRYLPSFLIGWYFTKERLASLVHIDLRPRHDPVTLELHPNGVARIYLQVINLCPVPLQLEAADFRLTYSGAQVKFIVIAKRDFGVGSIESLVLQEGISEPAADSIGRSPDNPVTLEGHVEFSSPIRSFAKTVGALEGIRPRLVNLAQRQKLLSAPPSA
jgi:hypothetical protein